MDGLPHTFSMLSGATQQRTLKTSIGCVGVGVHSGVRTNLTLHPAPVGTGIVFRRTDLNVDIPARFDHVVDTRMCTVLGLPDRPETRIGTVEHVLAALAGCGISNAIVAVDGPEVPILDGSAASFVFLIDCAGTLVQDAEIPVIEIVRTIRVTDSRYADGEGFVELRPSPLGLDMAMSIDFDAAAIGRQALSLRLTPDAFRAELARARTFAQATEIATLQAAGLARGGSLENAVVVDQARVLNPAGLRMPDEFVRHKLLDAVGDLALAGAALRGRFISHRGGHAMNNKLLRTLFADDANWRAVTADTAGPIMARAVPAHQPRQLQVAAAPV